MDNSSLTRIVLICVLFVSTVSTKELKKDSFRDLVNAPDGPSKNLFINFHSPRCPLCINLKPVWQTLDSLVSSQEAAFSQLVIGSVDCSKENELCNNEGVKGFPTLKIFRAGDPIGTEYEGPRDLSSLIELIYKQLKIEIKKEDPALKTLKKSDDEVGFGEDTDEDTVRGLELDRILNREELSKDAVDQPINGLYELSSDNYKEFLSKGRHFVKFFAPWCGHCQRLEPTWFKLADSFKHDKSVSISRINCEDYPDVCEDYGIKGYPSLMWIVDGKVKEKYQDDRKHETLKKFVINKIEEDKSEGNNARTEDLVAFLTETNFKKATSSGVAFVTFTTPWCSHCKRLEPVIEDLAVKMLSVKTERVIIAKVDCSQFDSLCTQEGVDGYPTMILYKFGVNVKEYEGERSLNDIFTFISQYLPKEDKDEL